MSKDAWKAAMSKGGKSHQRSRTQHAAKTLQMQCSQAVATDAFVEQEAPLINEAVLFC